MPAIKHLLRIEVQPEKVYQTISTIEGLKEWWTPQVEGSTQEGGEIKFGFGPEYFKKMLVKQITNEKVVWECQKAVEEWIGTEISFQIESKGDGTILHFSHSNWKDYSRMFSQCSFDWALFLRSLRKYCETGSGQPFPDHTK